MVTHAECSKVPPPPQGSPPQSGNERVDRANSVRWKYDPLLDPPPVKDKQPAADAGPSSSNLHLLRIKIKAPSGLDSEAATSRNQDRAEVITVDGGKAELESLRSRIHAYKRYFGALRDYEGSRNEQQKSDIKDPDSDKRGKLDETEPQQVEIDIDGKSGIVTNAELRSIVESFPPVFQLYTWKKVYDLSVDGASLDAVRDIFGTFRQFLIVIQDQRHQAFGAFVVHSSNDLGSQFFGTGETFIFRRKPTSAQKRESTDRGDGKLDGEHRALKDGNGNVEIFRWCGKNDMHVSITDKILSIGGGVYGPAILLDSHLNQGESNTCETYASPPLTGMDHVQLIRSSEDENCPASPDQKNRAEDVHVGEQAGNGELSRVAKNDESDIVATNEHIPRERSQPTQVSFLCYRMELWAPF